MAQQVHRNILRSYENCLSSFVLVKRRKNHGAGERKEYTTKYDVNNLWKANLSGAWRMVYTIRGSEVEIISLILDILNHKNYEKKFSYKRS